MGVKRRAKAGHYYERRRTRSGRFYTVRRGSDKDEWNATIWALCIMVGCFLAPFTYLMSLAFGVLIAIAATTSGISQGNSRRKGLDTGTRELRSYAELVNATEQPTPAPAPNLTEPPTRSTAWAYEPRNLGGGHTVVTTQFRPCKSDDDQPT